MGGATEVGAGTAVPGVGPLRIAAGFLRMQPAQLHKDVGQFPLQLARELGWQSELVYWMPTQVPLNEPEGFARWVRRVPVSYSPSRARHTLMFWRYLVEAARRIDVLLVYHLTSESLGNIALYKALNPRGVAVLKLDMDHRGLAAFEQSEVLSKRWALMHLFAKTPADFLIVETVGIYERLRPHVQRMGHRLHVVPVGIDCSERFDVEQVLREKEDVVLTAGRLGGVQKNNEQLLCAIEQLSPGVLGKWQFWFVGDRAPEFEARVRELRRRRPDLERHLVLREFVSSRAELAEVYRRARVYCLTSRWESFAIVLGEAAFNGCYLVSTDVGAARMLTREGHDGDVLPVEDTAALVRSLEGILTGSTRTEEAARRAHENVRDNFDWPVVARQFAELVHRYRSGRGARS